MKSKIDNSPVHFYCVKNQSQKQPTKKQTNKTTLLFVEQGVSCRGRGADPNKNVLCSWAGFSPTSPPLPLSLSCFTGFFNLRSIRVIELWRGLWDLLTQRFHFAEAKTGGEVQWLAQGDMEPSCTETLFMWHFPDLLKPPCRVLQSSTYLCLCTPRGDSHDDQRALQSSPVSLLLLNKDSWSDRALSLRSDHPGSDIHSAAYTTSLLGQVTYLTFSFLICRREWW